MIELLNWISNNAGTSFCIGVFLIVLVATFGDAAAKAIGRKSNSE